MLVLQGCSPVRLRGLTSGARTERDEMQLWHHDRDCGTHLLEPLLGSGDAQSGRLRRMTSDEAD